MKATKQYFPVVLFIVLYKVVLTFLSLFVIFGLTNYRFLTVHYFISFVIVICVSWFMNLHETIIIDQ